MKGRSGFVSNSSSTSFIVEMPENFTLGDFLQVMGVLPDSPYAKVCDEIWNGLIHGDRPEVVLERWTGEYVFESEFECFFHLNQKELRKRMKEGNMIRLGQVDEDPLQTYLDDLYRLTDGDGIETEKFTLRISQFH